MGNFGLFNQNKETAGCYYQVLLWASSQTYQTQGEIMIFNDDTDKGLWRKLDLSIFISMYG